MSTSQSETLTSDDLEYLLSLPDWELLAFLESLPKPAQTSILRQLDAYKTPREAAEGSLHEFVKQAWNSVEPDRDFVDSWHIAGVCGELEEVAAKRTRNLLINIPPGCMKSLLCNVFWPAWVWTHTPTARFLFASYGGELSIRDSIKMRYLIESPWYRQNWPEVRLTADQNQKIRYDTTQGGWRIATSVGGRGTGEHPDYVVADDPHNVQQSESDVERQQAIDWWDGTISMRGLTRNCCRVIIMQRLHEMDLSGHLLKKGVELVHVCLPMRFEPGRMPRTPRGFADPRTEPGELLCPALMPPEMVERAEKDLVSQYRISGQMQQRPNPAGGGMFKREHLPIVPDFPRECRDFIRYWDKAGTQGGGCNSAGVLMTRWQGITYVVNVVKGQWSPRNREQVMRQTAETDRQQFGHGVQIVMEREPASSGLESAQNSIANLAGFRVQAELASGDKEVRAQPFADQCEAGNVRLVAGPWNQSYIEELVSFPNGALKDQVDASSGAFNRLANTKKFMVA